MSPIELIKQGFESKDWNIIAQAYQSLTGQTLVMPQKISSSKPRKSKKNKDTSATISMNVGKTNIYGKTPEFFTQPATPAEQKEAEKLYKNVDWTPKGQRKPAIVSEILCSVCKRSFKNVPKVLIHKASKEDQEKYVCNECVGTKT